MLNDSDVHAPPGSGDQAYNATPNIGKVIAQGETYLDAQFGGTDATGSTIMRLKDIGAGANGNENYAYHAINADGTLCFYGNLDGTLDILSTVDGSIVYTDQPIANVGVGVAEVRWDMADTDKYYYWSTASIVQRNLAAQTNTTIKTFASNLGYQGGSQNYFDRNGRYWVVTVGTNVRVWDSQTDTLYTGNIPVPIENGWVTISPDGNYVAGVYAAGDMSVKLRSFLINHGAQTVDTTGVMFWDIGGDHTVIISASDGENYALCPDAQSFSVTLSLVDITVNREAMDADTQIASAITQAVTMDSLLDNDYHMSPVSKGSFADWAFINSETPGDTAGSPIGTWRRYKQEIMAFNVITFEKRRFCHHRSRTVGTYSNQPRVSCSPDGTALVFNSNMNDNTPDGNANLFYIANPLGVAAGGSDIALDGTAWAGGSICTFNGSTVRLVRT